MRTWRVVQDCASKGNNTTGAVRLCLCFQSTRSHLVCLLHLLYHHFDSDHPASFLCGVDLPLWAFVHMKLYRRYLVLNKCPFRCVACSGCLSWLRFAVWRESAAPPTRLECYCSFTAARWSEASFFCDSCANDTFTHLHQWNGSNHRFEAKISHHICIVFFFQ